MSNRARKVYTLKDELKDKINRGCDVVANHEKSKSLIDELRQIEFKSIYFVGCGFGEFLINTKEAFPEVDVGGCEIAELYKSFGVNTLGVDESLVTYEVKEPPYDDIPQADVIVCDDFIKDSPEQDALLKMIFERANKYVVMFYVYSSKIKEIGDFRMVDNNIDLDVFEIPRKVKNVLNKEQLDEKE